MSLISEKTQIVVQSPAFLLLFIVASFRTFEVTDPTDPREVAAVPVAVNANGQISVRTSDRIAFVTSGGNAIPNNLSAINVLPAYLPAFISNVTLGGGGTENVGALALDGAGNVFVVSQGTDELYAVDAVDPAAMSQTQDYNLGLVFTIKQFGPSAIAISGSIAYVLNYQFSTPVDKSTFLVCYDITNPAAVVQRGSVDLGLPAELDNSQRLGSIHIDGTLAICVFGSNLAIVDIADPDAPQIILNDDSAFEAAIHAAYDAPSKILFALDNTGWPAGPPTIRAIDLTAPARPRAVASTQPVVLFLNNAALRTQLFPTRRTLYVTGNGSSATAAVLLTYDVTNLERSGFRLQSTSGAIGTNGGAALAVAS